ncbi:hypothetical protein BD324DRAFT_402831 [Kockovaella imperatae]|uniref:DH domain-containing protein n=1 Tax=Kockovaella imperatae TaxID=4999 RepID=A0A1Y1UIP9_9TREE|nr:hypothetical protein BD324DRAFT_402831 [Kockovaella imperatae]ORX37849.1 hypothetical protein BD324DRAFT_402831 [Kockovaella imperatae]
MPIQRALRYKLLFADLMSSTPTGSSMHTLVSSALSTANRIADECNARQTVDVSVFRRQPTGSSTRFTTSTVHESREQEKKLPARQKRKSLGKEKVSFVFRSSHAKSLSNCGTTGDTIDGKEEQVPGARPKTKRRISDGPLGLVDADSPARLRGARSSWALF